MKFKSDLVKCSLEPVSDEAVTDLTPAIPPLLMMEHKALSEKAKNMILYWKLKRAYDEGYGRPMMTLPTRWGVAIEC